MVTADIRDSAAVGEALRGRTFDAVADFISFTPEHAAAAIKQFSGRTGQYVFISSASAYQKPPARLPILESTPLRNPFWQYSRDKIACEELLMRAYRDDGFPVTVVRPRTLTTAPRSPCWAAGRTSTGCGRACRCWSTATVPRCGR